MLVIVQQPVEAGLEQLQLAPGVAPGGQQQQRSQQPHQLQQQPQQKQEAPSHSGPMSVEEQVQLCTGVSVPLPPRMGSLRSPT